MSRRIQTPVRATRSMRCAASCSQILLQRIRSHGGGRTLMRVAIITFPGSNCDYDCYKALTDVVGVHAEYVWHRETSLGDADAVILPGGFSYGDYLRAGAIARFSPIMEAVQK